METNNLKKLGLDAFKKSNDEIMRSIVENMENRRSELFNASNNVMEAKNRFAFIDLPRPVNINHTLPIIRKPFFIPYDKKVADEVTKTGMDLLQELIKILPVPTVK